ncbi:MAG: hypothetical protein HYZ27_01815 [Deltaproteobacteria bacterium]|nr:hypothetical protein [Deltaproteobacteria bacterium]
MTACFLHLVMTAALTAAGAAAVPHKPAQLKFRQTSLRVDYELVVRPGVPEPGATAEVELVIEELLETPDPTFGSRRPLNEAEVHAVLVSGGKKKLALGRRGVRLADAGTYGFTFTVSEPGFYGLHIGGNAGEAGQLAFSVVLPYGVWPVPEGTKPAPLPARLPDFEDGDRAHGRALCEQRCKKDLPGALPAGATPSFLASAFATAYDDDALLAAVLTPGGDLATLERNDLLYYLHGLHFSVRDLFPSARLVMAKSFEINEHGRKRLAEALNKSPEAMAATATVFVAFKGEGDELTLVPYDDRVARDKLKPENKLGYLLFLDLPGEGKVAELAVAIAKEPSYAVVDVRARDSQGRLDAALNKELKTFIGQGRFNDPKSLRKGSARLHGKFLPVYLRAAEFATMYYGDEREFTQFDSEFAPPPAEAQTAQPKVRLKR